MNFIKKAFLFGVGVIAIAYEEVEKSIQKTLDAIQEERTKLQQQMKRQEAK